MRRLLAVAVVIGAFGVGASSASAAPPDFTAAQRLCEAQGGLFGAIPDDRYACNFYDWMSGSPTEEEVRAGRALCEQVYKGAFESDFDVNRSPPWRAFQYRCEAVSA